MYSNHWGMNFKKETYKRLGDYIRQVDERNRDLSVSTLLGLSMTKEFRPSTSNVVGTDISKYKIVREGKFAFDTMSVIRVHKVPICYNNLGYPIIISPAYITFEIINEKMLLPMYLKLMINRPEFDRYADFKSDSAVRGGYNWDELCETLIPIPDPTEQRRIVDQYNAIQKRIDNNKQMIAKLEDAAQAIYRKMFVEDIDPENLPAGWRYGSLSDIATITMGQSPSGETLNKKGNGYLFYQGCSDFGIRFVAPRVFTTAPTKYAEPFDILMSVRAPVGSLNITKEKCCIGRGLAAIRAKQGEQSFVLYTLKNQSLAFTIADDDGSVFGSINKDGINSLSIILPPDTVINEFNKNVSQIDDLIVQYESEINLLTKMLGIIL